MQETVPKEILQFHCLRYAEFPQVELYMDQVLQVLEQSLAALAPNSREKLLTSTMVNNYVKQNLLPPPLKKRYGREHLAHLLVICVLKQVLPIGDIYQLMRLQTSSLTVPEAYDYFCETLEAALTVTFTGDASRFAALSPGPSPEAKLVRTAALAFANKVYLQKYLAALAEK